MAYPYGKAVAASQLAYGFHMFMDDGEVAGVKQADEILRTPEVMARVAEETLHAIGNGEAAPGYGTFPNDVGYGGVAGEDARRRGGREVGGVPKAADEIQGRPAAVA